MKKIFRKAITVLGSVALIGATVGAAAAASYPDPFTSDSAIVVGVNAAPSDMDAALLIAADLNAETVASSTSTTTTSLVGAEGVTEDEIVLGGSIISGKVLATLNDAKLTSLLDEKISWDNGTSSEDYNIHEEIVIASGKMMVKTSFDDNDLDGIELSNDEGFSYRYVFDDAFPLERSSTDADDLYLTLLGKDYEVTAMTATTITVNTAEEMSVGIGESVTIDGKTFTVDDLASGSARINGVTVTADTTKKIDGLRVMVSDIFYNDNFPEQASLTLKVGEDISKTYSDGEEFIGEPETDYTWEWDLSNLGSANGYIGVKYAEKQTRAKDDMKAIGDGGYILPNNFAAITLDAITDVDYSDIKISFEENVDLYNTTDGSDATVQDAEVMVIEAVDGEKDAFKLDANTETNKIYVRWAQNTTSGDDMYSQGSGITGRLEVLYEDVNAVVGDAVRPRYFGSHATALALGNFTYGDTEVAITGAVSSGALTVSIVGTDTAQDTHTITVDVGGTTLGHTNGTLLWLGGTSESTSKETAETTDVTIGGENMGTKDYDVMTYDGFIVETPESNADDDSVVISIPSDKVYATVSVVAGGEAVTTGGDDDNSTTTDAGLMTVRDTQVSTVSGKNLIVVGGSAINTVAAELLGGALSEGAFTSSTGVAAGEFLINSYDRAGKTALLVAGYNAADTEKAVTYLINKNPDTTVGTMIKGTSATEATVTTA